MGSYGWKLLLNPTNVEEARRAVKAGAVAGYAFSALYVLGTVSAYLTGEIETAVGCAIVTVVIVALTYRYQTRPSTLIPLLLGAWFLVEIAGKIATSMAGGPRFHLGWLLLYAAMIAGFFSGFRGAAFLRAEKTRDDAR